MNIVSLEPILKQFQTYYALVHVEAFPTGPGFDKLSTLYAARFGEVLEDTTYAEQAQEPGKIGVILVGESKHLQSIEGRAFCMNLAKEMELNDVIELFEQDQIIFLPVILASEDQPKSIAEQAFDKFVNNLFTPWSLREQQPPPTVESLQSRLDECQLKLQRKEKQLIKLKAQIRILQHISNDSDSSASNDNSSDDESE